MKRINYLLVIVIAILATACGAPKVLVSYKDNAVKAETAGNFIEAVAAWKQYFNQTPIEETEGAVFAKAAKTAFKAGDNALAKSWFDQARYKDFSDEEMYSNLAKIYKSQNNISKELSALEFFTENFGNENDEVNNRLFDVYFEIESYEKALDIWQNMESASQNSASKLNSYFLIHKNLKDTTVCDSVALVLLDKESENMNALSWNAKKYYRQGQNRYEREMAKYNQKKTRKRYSILLKQLDLVTADFKKALPYLNTLWKLKPGKEYAGYLANIYARFGDEKKVNYYKKYLQE